MSTGLLAGIGRGLADTGKAMQKDALEAKREERLEQAEVLGDLEGAVMREHHAARPDADRARRRSDLADQDLGARARDAGEVVMLGDPEA